MGYWKEHPRTQMDFFLVVEKFEKNVNKDIMGF